MNQFKLNCDKSKYIVIGNIDRGMETVLEARSIMKCKELTYLGFVLDNELKMSGQIDKISKSIGRTINALRYLKDNLSNTALLKFFHAHIQSNINYCSFALLRCRQIDIERIQRLQSKALRIIFGLPDSYPSFELFTRVAKNILPVTGMIYMSALIMIKKCLQNIDNSLPKVSKLKSIRSRDLAICPAKKKILCDDITHIGTKLYNLLPQDIKDERNFFRFKKMLKNFLISRNESLIKSGQFTAKNFYI